MVLEDADYLGGETALRGRGGTLHVQHYFVVGDVLCATSEATSEVKRVA